MSVYHLYFAPPDGVSSSRARSTARESFKSSSARASRTDLYDSKNSLYDEDHNYAPGVLMCEFAATDADNIVDSFAKTEPFHVDKRGKDGILSHTDPKHDMPEDADTPTDA